MIGGQIKRQEKGSEGAKALLEEESEVNYSDGDISFSVQVLLPHSLLHTTFIYIAHFVGFMIYVNLRIIQTGSRLLML